MKASQDFPWGEKGPEGGYRVGDRVGIIHSDDTYLFDEPRGIVTAVEDVDGDQHLTVQVEVGVADDRLYLIEREEVNA